MVVGDPIAATRKASREGGCCIDSVRNSVRAGRGDDRIDASVLTSVGRTRFEFGLSDRSRSLSKYCTDLG